MAVYMDLAILLNFSVDFLLLLGTNRLCGYSPGSLRCCLASALGCIYGGACILPQCTFLGNTIWRIVFLSIMAVIAFGLNQSAFRRGVVFVFLSMALGGIAMGINHYSFISLVLAALGLLVMCLIGFRGKIDGQQYAAVELTAKGRKFRLTALRDTGNTLKDPVTGQQVLIVGADIAQRVIGLTPQQLSDPITTAGMGNISGLRLIPYRAVGQPCGMLLACCFDEVMIDGKPAGKLVAFAPDKIGTGGGYQALTGGEI